MARDRMGRTRFGTTRTAHSGQGEGRTFPNLKTKGGEASSVNPNPNLNPNPPPFSCMFPPEVVREPPSSPMIAPPSRLLLPRCSFQGGLAFFGFGTI